MGIWNATCGVSFLPIRQGPVRAILLGWHPPTLKGEAWLHEPTSTASPLSFAVRGRYDLYGSIEAIADSEPTRALWEGLRRRWQEGTLSIEGAAEFPADLPSFFKAVERTLVSARITRRLPFGEVAQEVVPLALMFVLEGIYDAVVHEVETSRDWECRRDFSAEEAEGELRRALPNLELYRPPSGPMSAAVRKELASFLRFHHGLDVLRRPYLPATAVGSQAMGLALHRAVHEEAGGYLEDWGADEAED